LITSCAILCWVCQNKNYDSAKVQKNFEKLKLENNNFILAMVASDEFLRILNDILLRPFNKVEMCRLQGFPDNYCDILTTAKAGSLLGDGWTLPIIEHIFSYINK
jgi:hypothetical protein